MKSLKFALFSLIVACGSLSYSQPATAVGIGSTVKCGLVVYAKRGGKRVQLLNTYEQQYSSLSSIYIPQIDATGTRGEVEKEVLDSEGRIWSVVISINRGKDGYLNLTLRDSRGALEGAVARFKSEIPLMLKSALTTGHEYQLECEE